MKVRSKEEVVEEYRIQSIREAAMRVIARSGLSDVTMQQIADEAGVAKGTLYLYFQNREELIEKTAEFAFSVLEADLDEAFRSEGSFREQFTRVLRTKIEFFHENQDFFRVYMSIRFPDGAPRACAKPRHAGFMEKLTSLFGEAAGEGTVQKCDPARLALFVNEGTNAVIFRRMGESSPPSVADEVEFIVEVVLNGIESRKDAK